MKLKIKYSHSASSDGVHLCMGTRVFGITVMHTENLTWGQWDIAGDRTKAIRLRYLLCKMRHQLKEKAWEVMPAPALWSYWQHKNGNIYRVIHVTSMPEPHKAHKFPITVIYQAFDGRSWPRTLPSFFGSMTYIGMESN